MSLSVYYGPSAHWNFSQLSLVSRRQDGTLSRDELFSSPSWRSFFSVLSPRNSNGNDNDEILLLVFGERNRLRFCRIPEDDSEEGFSITPASSDEIWE